MQSSIMQIDDVNSEVFGKKNSMKLFETAEGEKLTEDQYITKRFSTCKNPPKSFSQIGKTLKEFEQTYGVVITEFDPRFIINLNVNCTIKTAVPDWLMFRLLKFN